MTRRVTKQGTMAAIVCMSSDVNEQRFALKRIRSQDLLRRILAFFVLGRDEMWMEDHPPNNTEQILKDLREKICWSYFGILNSPPPHMALVTAAVWNRRFLEEVFFARGFCAPCMDPEDGEDWRYATYFRAVQQALPYTDKNRTARCVDKQSVARRDARLVREVLRDPCSLDAELFADGIREPEPMIFLASKIERQNPQLADSLRYWAKGC